ncbi:hypothetical protein CLU79DRAFT_778712 [Phycomyces nitens]|nr:hypothetical protein CLU79DRAFT_778712 [Phycomyces nitens]
MNNTVISLLTNLDRFTPDIEELVISIGNDTSNSIWDPLMHLEPNEHPEEDASIDSRPRIKPDSTYDQKTRYIQDKYTARVYVCSASSSPNQELMDAIGLDDIPAAMLAISRGVDFNTAWYSTPCSLAPKTSNDGDPDGQERTPSQCCEPYHPLHKALLYGREVPTTQASNRSLLFPMAELLFQHGASTNVIDLLTHKTLRQIIDHDTNIQSSAIEYIDERHRFHGKNSRA